MGGGGHTEANAAVRGLLVGLISLPLSPGDPVWVARLGGISEPSYLEASQKLGSLDTLSC